MGTLHEDQYIFLIIYRSVRRRLRNVSDKSCRGNQNLRLMFNVFFFENLANFEITWEIMVDPGRSQINIQ